MFSYTRKEINVLAMLITAVLFTLVLFNMPIKEPEKIKHEDSQQEEVNYNIQEEKPLEQLQEQEETDENKWQLWIPKIDLIAPIQEGTGEEIMEEAVGHFTETSKNIGNIGLAAHNKGYPLNYFARLKELEKWDVILYQIEKQKKIFLIDTIEKIEETDWSYLQETEEDRITLITCIENQPKYRLCIQAKLLEEL